MRRVLLAFHRPGRRGEEARVVGLAEKVETMSMGRLRVDATVVDEVDESAGERYDGIYLLMFTRGGHWLSVVEAAGVAPKLIPQPLTAAIMAREAVRNGLRRVVIVGLRARRAEHLQLEDLQLIELLLAAWKLDSHHILLETVDSEARLEERWCRSDTLIAPLALLDGGLAENARRLAASCNAKHMPPILHVAEPLLATWILWDALHRRG